MQTAGSSSFQAALLATARIAGVAMVVACAPKQPAAVAPAASSDVPVTAASAEPVNDFDTCEALTAKALKGVPMEAAWDPSLKPKNVSAEVKECCTMLLSGQATGQQSRQVRARWACCGVVDDSGMACTPWGPPSPPAFA